MLGKIFDIGNNLVICPLIIGNITITPSFFNVIIRWEILDKSDSLFGYNNPDYNDLKDKMLEVYYSYDFYKKKAFFLYWYFTLLKFS